ncbi:MAG: glycosyltransferase family 2 protein [Candidatus Jordarchaeaceae archaeon]
MESTKNRYKAPEVSIVIVARNPLYLKNCLKSIQKSRKEDIEIIVSDNSENDDILNILNKFNNMKIKSIKNMLNVGHASGTNIAVKEARGHFIFKLDEDTEIKENCINELLRVIKKNEKIACVSPTIMEQGCQKKVQSVGLFIDSLGFTYNISNLEIWNNPYNFPFPIFFPPGPAFLLRRDIIKNVSIMDDVFDGDYFIWGDDLDLGWRILLAGYISLSVPKAISYHRKAKALRYYKENTQFHLTKNQIASLIKNYSCKNLFLHLPVLLILMVGKAVLILRFNSRHTMAIFKGMFWTLFNLRKIYLKRKIVQSKIRKVQDSYVKKFMFTINVSLLARSFTKAYIGRDNA